MAFQGNSEIITIPDLFNFVCHRRLSGMLVVASRGEDRSFVFQDGEMVYALASEPGELMGEVLVRELGLDPQIIEHAKQGAGRFLGENLILDGAVTQEDLDLVMERQIRMILREVLRWDEWAFHFQPHEGDSSVPTLRLSTQLLVFDLSRELDEWQSLPDTLPDLDMVPCRSEGSLHMGGMGEWPGELPAPGEILEAVDGERSLRRLLHESPLPVRAHAEGLRQALDAGIILAGDQDKADEVPPRERNPWQLLPVIPNLSRRILAMNREHKDGLEEFYELVESDPVVTARVLRLASLHRHDNDGPFSLRNVVSGVGLRPVKALLLADAVRDLFLDPSTVTWRQLWEQAYKASFTCHCIAELVDYPEPDMAQVAGLLQDIGCIALAGRDAASYQQVYEFARITGGDLLAAERNIFDTDHCEVGREIAEHWGFPGPIATAIRDHHSAPGGGPDELLVNIVRMANHLVAPPGTDTLSNNQLKRLRGQIGVSSSDFDLVRSRVEEWGYGLQTSGVLVGTE